MKINNINGTTSFKKVYDYSGNYTKEQEAIAKDIRFKMSYLNPISSKANQPDLLLLGSSDNSILVKMGRVVNGKWDYYNETDIGVYNKSNPFNSDDLEKGWKKSKRKKFLEYLCIAGIPLIGLLALPILNKCSQQTKEHTATEIYQQLNKQSTDTINVFKKKI